MRKASKRPGKNYEVGYGRPPKATRFKPGQSGNPKGKKKGSKNASTLAKAELGRKVVVTASGKRRQMTVEQIAYRRLGDKSMVGDQKAFGFLLMLANNIEPSQATAASTITTPEQDLAIIQDYFKRRGGEGGAK